MGGPTRFEWQEFHRELFDAFWDCRNDLEGFRGTVSGCYASAGARLPYVRGTGSMDPFTPVSAASCLDADVRRDLYAGFREAFGIRSPVPSGFDGCAGFQKGPAFVEAAGFEESQIDRLWAFLGYAREHIAGVLPGREFASLMALTVFKGAGVAKLSMALQNVDPGTFLAANAGTLDYLRRSGIFRAAGDLTAPAYVGMLESVRARIPEWGFASMQDVQRKASEERPAFSPLSAEEWGGLLDDGTVFGDADVRMLESVVSRGNAVRFPVLSVKLRMTEDETIGRMDALGCRVSLRTGCDISGGGDGRACGPMRILLDSEGIDSKGRANWIWTIRNELVEALSDRAGR